MITTFYAGLLAILYAGLTVFVVRGRWKYGVGLGDGSHEALTRCIRIHGNFAEYTPFCLLLIFMVDYSDYSPVLVHTLGIMLVAGRIFHAWGLYGSSSVSFGRAAGMILTVSVLLIAGILLIWKFLILRLTGF